jgi:hypothetical protein
MLQHLTSEVLDNNLDVTRLRPSVDGLRRGFTPSEGAPNQWRWVRDEAHRLACGRLHKHLHALATKPGEKCGLVLLRSQHNMQFNAQLRLSHGLYIPTMLSFLELFPG